MKKAICFANKKEARNFFFFSPPFNKLNQSSKKNSSLHFSRFKPHFLRCSTAPQLTCFVCFGCLLFIAMQLSAK